MDGGISRAHVKSEAQILLDPSSAPVLSVHILGYTDSRVYLSVCVCRLFVFVSTFVFFLVERWNKPTQHPRPMDDAAFSSCNFSLFFFFFCRFITSGTEIWALLKTVRTKVCP